MQSPVGETISFPQSHRAKWKHILAERFKRKHYIEDSVAGPGAEPDASLAENLMEDTQPCDTCSMATLPETLGETQPPLLSVHEVDTTPPSGNLQQEHSGLAHGHFKTTYI